MKSAIFSGLMLALVVILFSAKSHGDVANSTAPNALEPDPITGTPVVSAPGMETPPHDPFTPYDVGPPGGVWKYEDLSPEEKIVADRNRDVTGWSQVFKTFASNNQYLATQMLAARAEYQLGVTDLGAIGVVP